MGFLGGWSRIPSGEVRIEDKVYHIEPFWIGTYPVTYSRFRLFIDAPDGFYDDQWWVGLDVPDKNREKPGQQRFMLDDHPCEWVSWYDAIAYCRWLSFQHNIRVRLPTEWEWQWAAQGPKGREYPWGDRFDKDRCNTDENGINSTTPVDCYPTGVSPFGVMDMAGNVWEWCLNEYELPDNTNFEGDAPRSVRGGSWGHDLLFARVTFRDGGRPQDRSNYQGFRLAMDSD